VQLSNVKQDPAVFKAQNDLAAAAAQADAIAKIGEAIRRNPEYREYMKWQFLKEIAATGTQKGTSTLIVVGSHEQSSADCSQSSERKSNWLGIKELQPKRSKNILSLRYSTAYAMLRGNSVEPTSV